MTAVALLDRLTRQGVRLAVKGDELVVRGKTAALDPSLLTELRQNKAALIQLIQSKGFSSSNDDAFEVPPNLIGPGCEAITPSMLPLLQLTSEQIARVVATVPGGAPNVQDIYPLAPLQGNILFQYLMQPAGDLFFHALFNFENRSRLSNFLQALQAVIDRHDILRTAFLWEGLPEPVQVVWRRAPLVVEEIDVTSQTEGEAAAQLTARFDKRHYRMDVRSASLMRVAIAHDESSGRWLLLCLLHHLSGDQATLEQIRQEMQVHLVGKAQQLPKPLPFRNFVARACLGVSREDHEKFFRELLGDVDEPTVPGGVSGMQYDSEATLQIDAVLTQRLRACARRLGVTAASLFHVAYAQVLARLSGRDDVVFGSVLLGRTQGEGAAQALGLFINALPVRIKLGDTETVQAVRAAHSLLAQLMRHEHAPLALVQRCSGVAAPMPLFSALLNFRQGGGLGRDAAGS